MHAQGPGQIANGAEGWMSGVSEEVARVCAEIREAEIADMASHFESKGFDAEMAKHMAELVMLQMEALIYGCAWRETN